MCGVLLADSFSDNERCPWQPVTCLVSEAGSVKVLMATLMTTAEGRPYDAGRGFAGVDRPAGRPLAGS